METREKQRILTMIIMVSVLAIAVIIGFIIVPEINEQISLTSNEKEINKDKDNNVDREEKEDNSVNKDEKDSENNVGKEEKDSEDNYVGKEEKNSEDTVNASKTNDERAIELAKNKWGETDETVLFNIEQKDGSLYYVAVRKDTQVMKWYEVNTELWTIEEY